MDRERVFRTVRDHMLRQGQRSADSGKDGCMYRGPHGLRCAIGALIPDGLYHSAMEGEGVRDLLKAHRPVRLYLEALYGSITSDDEVFLNRLQYVHDQHPVDEWVDALDVVASDYGLAGL